MKTKSLSILGIRGIPASHGGFETFAEKLATYLTEKEWRVTVYCQEEKTKNLNQHESTWNGIRRIHIPVKGSGAKSTIIFDLLSTLHASREQGIMLTLGYNTAIFSLIPKARRKTNIINMDGIEWKRNKWKWHEKAWLYINERAGSVLSDHMIADHPEIKNHLARSGAINKITMIPYGARNVTAADAGLLKQFNLDPRGYALVIARPEPENSILEIVTAFSAHKRECKLAILGKYDPGNTYHQQVMAAAGPDVVFLGPVYDHSKLDALRLYSLLYIHGHTVGGTNPSLVEALGSGQPILAHDNKFNRWVAGAGAAYFTDQNSCRAVLDTLLEDASRLDSMSKFSRVQFQNNFTWEAILAQYEELLLQWTQAKQ